MGKTYTFTQFFLKFKSDEDTNLESDLLLRPELGLLTFSLIPYLLYHVIGLQVNEKYYYILQLPPCYFLKFFLKSRLLKM